MGSTAATSAGRRRAAARAPAAGGKRSKRGRAAPAKRSVGSGKRGGGTRPPGGPRSTGRRAAGKPRRPAPARRARGASRTWSGRLALVAAIAGALVAGYFGWLRDSSLVAVTNVSVNGVESGDHQRIVAALTRAGESMTTLNVAHEELASVAARFPTIESVRADASLLHDLEIEVTERPPALAARSAGEETAVAADGTVLPGVQPAKDLPRLDVEGLPDSGRLEGDALAQALVVAAAPEQLAPLIRRVSQSEGMGVEATMRGGIALRFGSGANAVTKWAAAAAVLADPKLESAAYVDVRVPSRPAVGGGDA